MLIGHFTEQPWQDNTTGLMGTQSLDLSISNGVYDPNVGAKLYNRYLDEKVYAEEMGFDALMLNELYVFQEKHTHGVEVHRRCCWLEDHPDPVAL